MSNTNRIILSVVLIALCVISFVLFDYGILNESINVIIETLSMTLAGCLCSYRIAKIIDFKKVITFGTNTSLFCLICCLLFYSLKGCEYSVTKNPFRDFVFPISSLLFSLLCLVKIWIRPKTLHNQVVKHFLVEKGEVIDDSK